MSIPGEAVEAAAKAISPRWDDWKLYRSTARNALEAAAPFLESAALDEAATEFELYPHNSKGKMARHFNGTYVRKLRDRAQRIWEQAR